MPSSSASMLSRIRRYTNSIATPPTLPTPQTPIKVEVIQRQNELEITLDQVVASLSAFKKTMYNVDYLVSLINNNSELIKTNKQNASVIKPIIQQK